MGASRYVGRVGALAVALGVGWAVTTGSGIAVADSPNDGSTGGTAAGVDAPTGGAPTGDGDTASDAPTGETTTSPGPTAGTTTTTTTTTTSDTTTTSSTTTTTGDTTTSSTTITGTLTPTPTPTPDPTGATPTATPSQATTASPTPAVRPVTSVPNAPAAPTGSPAPETSGTQPASAAATGAPVSAITAAADATGTVSSLARAVATSVEVSTGAAQAPTALVASPQAAISTQPVGPIETLLIVPTRIVVGLLSLLVSPVVGSPANPVTPGPVFDLLVAFYRRIDNFLFNVPPTARPSVTGQSPTGVITGQLNASDANGDPLTYRVTAQPSNGRVEVGPDGSFTYTPTADFAMSGGPDSFTVVVDDSAGFHLFGFLSQRSISVPVSITVTPINQAPRFTQQAAITGQSGASGTISGTSTAVDPNGDTVTYSIKAGDTTATVSVDASGRFTYTPTDEARHAAALRPTTDVVTITASDGRGLSATSTVSVPVLGRNAAPVTGGLKDVVTDPATGTVTGSLNVSDPDNSAGTVTDTLTYTPATITTDRGTFTVDQNGRFSYTPTDAARHAAAKLGSTATTDSATFTVTDGYGGRLDVPVTVAILGRNAAPAATGTPTVGAAGALGAVVGDLKIVDSDGDPLTFTVTSPTRGRVEVRADGTFTYTPDEAARIAAAGSGPTTDSFSVTAADGYGGVTATPVVVTVDIAPLNLAPIAGTPGSPTVDYATGAVSGKVNFTDPNGNPLSYNVSGQPDYGTVTVGADGSFTFTPTAAQRLLANTAAGPKSATFAVTASDGSLSTATTVTVAIDPARLTVTDVIKTPTSIVDVGAGPTRVYAIGNDGVLTAIDPATGQVVGTTRITGATNTEYLAVSGDGRYVYVSGGSGRVVAVDTTTGSQTAYTVNGTPRDLVAVTLPTGQQRLYVTSRTTAKVTVIDPSGAAADVVVDLSAGASPNNIAASRDGRFVYVSNSGTNSVTIIDTATNGTTGITPTVPVGSNPQGLATSADGRYVYIANGSANQISVFDTRNLTVSAIAVASASRSVTVSPDGTLAYAVLSNGTVSVIDTATNTLIGAPVTVGSTPQYVAFTPDGQAYLSSFSGGVNVLKVVSVNVNVPPVGVRPPTVGTPNATTGVVTGNLNVADANGDRLTYTPTSGTTAKGDFTIAANGTFTYTPNDDARHAAALIGAPASVRTDSFSVTVGDGKGGTSTVTVSVTVAPKNTAPAATAAPSVNAPAADASVTGNVNIGDADGDRLTYTPTAPARGTVTINPDGSFIYRPTDAARIAAAGSGPGVDTFSVTAADGYGGATAAPVSVTVSIAPLNVAPVAGTPTAPSTDYSTGIVTGKVRFTDANDRDTLTYSVTQQPAVGAVTVAADGTYTYTPTLTQRLAAFGTGPKTATFAITASDGALQTPSRVTVTIDPVRYVVVDSVAVGPAIDTATSTQAAAKVWVIGNTGTLTAIDPATGKVVTTIRVTGATNTEYLAVSRSPGQTFVYVSGGSGNIVVVNTVTGEQKSIAIGGVPRDLVAVASGDQDRLYVVSRDTSKITVVDPVAGTTRTLDLPAGSGPNNIVASRDGAFVVVSNNGTNSLTFVDTATDAMTSVSVGAFPQGLDVTPDGRYVYVANRNDGSVSVVDVAAKSVVATIAVEAGPRSVKLSDDGTLAFVTNQFADTVTVVDTVTNTVVGRVAVGDSPQYVAIPATGDVYVTNGTSGTVSVLRPASVNVNSAPVNVLPPSIGIPDATTGVVRGSLNVSDPDGNSITYSPATGITSKGEFSIAANGTYTYTPSAEARSAAAASAATPADKQDSFTVTASDGSGGVTPVTVTVTVLGAPVNTAPVVTNATLSATAGQPRTITLTGTDADAGTTLTFTVTAPAHGTVSAPVRVDATTVTVTYTPSASYSGPDSVTFTAYDGIAYSNTATVSITVNPVAPSTTLLDPARPVTVNPVQDSATGAAVGTVNTIATGLTYQIGTPPRSGSVTVGADGSFTYTPDPVARLTANGTASTVDDTDVFTIRVTDGVVTETVVVTPSVSPSSVAAVYVLPSGATIVDEPVLAAGDGRGSYTYVVVRDAAGAYSVNVLARAAAPRTVALAGEPVSPLSVTGTTAGIVSRAADGTFTAVLIRPSGVTTASLTGSSVEEQFVDAATDTAYFTTDSAITVVPRTGTATTIAVNGEVDGLSRNFDGSYVTTVKNGDAYSIVVVRPNATSYTVALTGEPTAPFVPASDGRLAVVTQDPTGTLTLTLIRADGTAASAPVPGLIKGEPSISTGGVTIDFVSIMVGTKVVLSRTVVNNDGSVSSTRLQERSFTGTPGQLHLDPSGTTAYLVTETGGVYSMFVVTDLGVGQPTRSKVYALAGTPVRGVLREPVLNAASNTLYQVTNAGTEGSPRYSITVIDTATQAVITRTLEGTPVGTPVVQESTGVAYLLTESRDGAWVNVLNVGRSTGAAITVPTGLSPDEIRVDQTTGIARVLASSAAGTYELVSITPTGASSSTTLSGKPKGDFAVGASTGGVYVMVSSGDTDSLDIVDSSGVRRVVDLPGKQVGDLYLSDEETVYVLTRSTTGAFAVTTLAPNRARADITIAGVVGYTGDPMVFSDTGSLVVISRVGTDDRVTIVKADGSATSTSLPGVAVLGAVSAGDGRTYATSVSGSATTVTTIAADGTSTSAQVPGVATTVVEFTQDGVYQRTSTGVYLVALPASGGSTGL